MLALGAGCGRGASGNKARPGLGAQLLCRKRCVGHASSDLGSEGAWIKILRTRNRVA